jgi:hypothetical protein
MNWLGQLRVAALLFVGMLGSAHAIYVDGDPLTGTDPMGLANSNAARMPTPNNGCFNYDVFANYIRDHAFNADAVLASLTADMAVGTMPKTAAESRMLGPRTSFNPITGQSSRWAQRTGYRGFREFGRTPVGKGIGAAATGAVVVEGYYDWGVIMSALNAATRPEACQCQN